MPLYFGLASACRRTLTAGEKCGQGIMKAVANSTSFRSQRSKTLRSRLLGKPWSMVRISDEMGSSCKELTVDFWQLGDILIGPGRVENTGPCWPSQRRCDVRSV